MCSLCSLSTIAFKRWCSRVNRLMHISFFSGPNTNIMHYFSMTPFPILLGLYLLEREIFGNTRSFKVSWTFVFLILMTSKLINLGGHGIFLRQCYLLRCSSVPTFWLYDIKMDIFTFIHRDGRCCCHHGFKYGDF